MEEQKTEKRDFLIKIESKYQEYWCQTKKFESNPDNREKYFVNFPYPYMNGKLHLGHCFTFSKAEFMVSFQRLQGKNCLFPFSFHCTGMPIKDKIVEKKVVETYQFQIMEAMGIPKSSIKCFRDPAYWTQYFPPLAQQDVTRMGCKVDWRRSFITTDLNLYYDAFAQWQFRRLKQMDKVKFGKRYTIYSPFDGQPCMDHDRQSGEGVGPLEYTCVKLQILQFTNTALKLLNDCPALDGKKIFLVAATLRPETMYGQTNCFVSSKITYQAYTLLNRPDEVIICTEKSAKNMAYQDVLNVNLKSITKFPGEVLIGSKVMAPLSLWKEVYVLPMDTILPGKGTGIVTSVPSDSPADYITMMDLSKKIEYYKIEKEWIQKFIDEGPIQVISTEEYGNCSAKLVCEQLKIMSPKDAVLLEKAKDLCYKAGFYHGKMIPQPYLDQPVQEAKPIIRKQLIEANLAFSYAEPESVVVSRSGDECVVSLMDQWYLDYGEEKWRQETELALKHMELFGLETRNQFEKVLEWLNQWACARSFGLGTKLPWDHEFLIESLSDSTFYMALYTISNLIMPPGNFNGKIKDNLQDKGLWLGILPEQINDEFFNYVFLDIPISSSDCNGITKETLNIIRKQFLYYYPFDLRVSGKDLIPNHLTFCLYNHVALYPALSPTTPHPMWPQGFRSNGHLLLNNEKMSKSTGNFMTLNDALNLFGADATRVALADAGDGTDDANFEVATANAAILKMYTLYEWIEQVHNGKNNLRKDGEDSFLKILDRYFLLELLNLVEQTKEAYSSMLFRQALKNGFYDLLAHRDFYRDVCGTLGVSMNLKCFEWFVKVQSILFCPITPHFSCELWTKFVPNKVKEDLIDALWDEELKELSLLKDSELVLEKVNYLKKILKTIKAAIANMEKKSKGKSVHMDNLALFVAPVYPSWKLDAIQILKEVFDTKEFCFKEDLLKQKLIDKGLIKDKKLMPFIMEIKKRVLHDRSTSHFNESLLFSELDTIPLFETYFKTLFRFSQVHLVDLSKEELEPKEGNLKPDNAILNSAMPGEPLVRIW